MKLIDLYKPIRAHSYPMTAVLVVLAVFYFQVVAKGANAFGVLLTLGLAFLFWGLWRWLHPGKSEVERAEQVFQAIGSGKPVFLNVYSNY